MRDFETRLADLRLDKNLKQREVADILGVSQTVYSKWEKNTNDIPLEQTNKLANYYGVSIDYLLGYSKTNHSVKPDIDYNLLKERLLLERIENKLSQSTLGDKTGFLQKTYSNYENGTRIPTTFKLLYIAMFYHISMDYLLGKKDNPQVEIFSKTNC